MPIQRHNLDDFVVDDRKRQMNAKRKVSRSRRFPNVKHDPHPVTRSGTQHQPIATVERPSWCLDDSRGRPPRQFVWRGHQIPDVERRRANNGSRANMEHEFGPFDAIESLANRIQRH